MRVMAHKAQMKAQFSGTAGGSVDGRVAVPAQRAEPVRRVHRVPAHRPPTRHRALGAPRVLPRATCAPRRARLSVVWVLAVASAACAAVVGLGALAGAVEPSVPSTTTVVRVQPGESLWELAGRVAPESDVSAVVERIRELNVVDGGLRPGQPLTVPFER
jgi:hypothetical protein